MSYERHSYDTYFSLLKSQPGYQDLHATQGIHSNPSHLPDQKFHLS